MNYEGLGEMFEGDFADMYAEKCLLLSSVALAQTAEGGHPLAPWE